MDSVTQLSEIVRQILEEEAKVLAKESGFIQRERVLSGADFAQTLIFGWLAEPEITLDGLTQAAGRREVEITASGLCQRFPPEAASFLHRLLQRLTQGRLEVEAAPIALLKRFGAVIVEDSTTISLPDELAECWCGCGGSAGSSQAALKLFVRWNVLTGALRGPLLTQGRHADGKSPFNEEEVAAGGLYLADLGFFGLRRLQRLSQRIEGRKRYYLMRLPPGTGLYTRAGHRLDLRGIVPQQQGASVELGVLLGQQTRIPARLIVQRVPEEVAEQRRKRIRQEAQDHGREPSKAAQVVQQLLRSMRSGCRIEKRKRFPSTVQRLEGAPVLGGKRPQYPKGRHRDQARRWPAGKGWATSKPGSKPKMTVSSLT